MHIIKSTELLSCHTYKAHLKQIYSSGRFLNTWADDKLLPEPLIQLHEMKLDQSDPTVNLTNNALWPVLQLIKLTQINVSWQPYVNLYYCLSFSIFSIHLIF